tara:strand:+ start:101 stop:1435 length:1335 start_codon:yes stop_codon:yes gene_type:complete
MRILVLSSVTLFVLCSSALAETTTLNQALEATYKNNPSIAQQREKLLELNEIVVQKSAALMPSVNANLKQDLDDVNGKYANTATLTIKQLIYDGGKSLDLIDSSKLTVFAERELLIQSEQNSLLNVITSYMDLRQAIATLDLAASNVSVLSQQLRASQNRFEVGEVTRTDVSQTEARLASAVSNVKAGNAAVLSQIANYFSIVGEEPGTLETPPKHPIIPADVATAEAIALNNHPRIRAAKLYLQAADQTISATRKNTNPIISGTLTSSIGSSIKSSIGAKIEASIPIFSGGELRSKQRSAVNARQAKKYALDTAVSSTRYNLNSYYATWQAALAAIKASNAQIESARIAFEGVTEEAKLGSRTTLDVLDAEQELLSARLNLVSALRDEQVQAYKVLAEMGQLTASSLGLNIKLYDPTLDYNKIVIESPLGKARIKLLEKLKNR